MAPLTRTRPLVLVPSSFVRAALVLMAATFVAWAPVVAQEAAAPAAPATDLSADVARIAERYGGGDFERTWLGASALEDLGDDAFLPLQTLLEKGTPRGRLMAAKALITMGEVDGVPEAMGVIAEDTTLPVEDRIAALTLSKEFASEKNDELLKRLLDGDEGYDPRIRIAAAAALSRHEKKLAREKLVPLLDTDEPAVRQNAALRLAELDYLDTKVRTILRALSAEPTPDGKLAATLLWVEDLLRERDREMATGAASGAPELHRELENAERKLLQAQKEIEELRGKLQRGESAGTPALLEELQKKIRDFYAEPERLDDKKLIISAAKGMAESLDPFSSFMDPDDVKEFDEDLSGDYAGIGTEVGKDPDTGYLRILRPIYGAPAYREGLLSDDSITEIDGHPVKDLSFDKIVKLLKGEAGTEVRLKVYRRGWEERDYIIRREKIHLPSVQSTLLPGHIGYVELMRFGEHAFTEFKEAVDKLELAHMRGLIVDLRWNPGGYLDAACRIVDEFVGLQEQPIVTQKGASRLVPPDEQRTTEPERAPYPLVVLINESSASASEIVAGALQDYKRATIVGERSYGKGSVQRVITLPPALTDSVGGECRLRVTVQYYYLPSGRSIHTQRDSDGRVTERGGVVPDVLVEPEYIALYRIEAVNELIRAQRFSDYLDTHYEKNHDVLRRVAEDGDGGDTSVYPDFNESFMAEGLNVPAQPDDVRRELRKAVRRRIADERGRDFACDYPEDRQLQKAILALLEKLGSPATEVPEYASFAAKIDEKPPEKAKK